MSSSPAPTKRLVRPPRPDPTALLASWRHDPLVRLRSGRDLARQRRERSAVERLPTGLPSLDRLLDGGLPRGRLVELTGRRSSGRFAAVLATLAATTAGGEAAALVDLGEGLEPAAAAAAGAELERLLWIRPGHLRLAALGAEMLLATGFPLVALDLGQPPVAGGRGTEAVWLRLARAAAGHDATLLVSSPYRVSGTAAAAVIEAGRARPVWRHRGHPPHLLCGLRSRLTLTKRRREADRGRNETLALRAPGSTSDSDPEWRPGAATGVEARPEDPARGREQGAA